MTAPWNKTGGKRDWTLARAKCDAEGCRVCGDRGELVEAAHVVARSVGGTQDSDAIVPLCRKHHREYDALSLDLLPYLTWDEFAQAVRTIGPLAALERVTGEHWAPSSPLEREAV